MLRSPNRVLHIAILAVVVVVVATAAWQSPLAPSPPARLEEMPAGGGGGPPGSAAEEARRLLAEGRPDDAIAAADRLIGEPEPGLDADARLVKGKVLLTRGEARAALELFDDLASHHAEREQGRMAVFFQGRAWERLGDDDRALDAYRRYAALEPNVAPYIHLIIADRLHQRGQPAEAESEANAAIGRDLPPRTEVAALELIRATRQDRDDLRGYLDATERLLDLATLPQYRAELRFQRGEALRALGQDAEALNDFRGVVTDSPDSPYADDALDALGEMGAADTILLEQRGLVLFYAGRYPEAIETFNAALSVNPQSDRAWYYRALSQLRSGNEEAAARELRGLAEGFPTSAYAPDALFQAGRLSEQRGQYDDARAAYEGVLQRYRTSDAARDASFRLGFLRYLEGDYPAAADAWSTGAASSGGNARLSFWLGKARDHLGDRDGASRAWRDALEADPDGFYGVRAEDLVSGRPEPRAATRPLPGSAADVSDQARADLARWYQDQGVSEERVRASVEADPAFQRATTLLDLDLGTEAGWEISALAERFSDDLPRLAMLANLLGERWDMQHAYEVADKVIDVAREHSITVPEAVDRLRYPLPYPELIVPLSRNHGADALLLTALIRQESQFNPSARSPAGALGLTQVLPSTGEEIAASLGMEDWKPEDLLRPAVAIEFGAVFLSDRLEAYDGRIFPALAAYNAGDGPVEAWLRLPGADDPDVFAERIDYPETADYLQRVYTNYRHYVRLYDKPDGS